MRMLAAFFERDIIADSDTLMPYCVAGLHVDLTWANEDSCHVALTMTNIDNKCTRMLKD